MEFLLERTERPDTFDEIEIKTLDERKEKLLKIGQKQGYVTYEQLAEQLKGLEVDSDSLDELYNFLFKLYIFLLIVDLFIRFEFLVYFELFLIIIIIF